MEDNKSLAIVKT